MSPAALASSSFLQETGKNLPRPSAGRLRPSDNLIRAAVCAFVSRCRGTSREAVARELYGSDDTTLAIVQRNAVSPGTLTTTGFAAELAATGISDFIVGGLVSPAFASLSKAGIAVTFDSNASIRVPSRTISASSCDFVSEGSAIPVRQLNLGSVSLSPRKMATISAFSIELEKASTPTIESVIRRILTEALALALDSKLLDNVAASAARPAGLLNGVTPIAASGATAAYDKMVGDLKAMMGALLAANPAAKPLVIAAPQQALALQWVTVSDGNINQLAIPVIASPALASGTVVMIDSAGFAAGLGFLDFDVSDEAAMHFDDAPSAISTPGAPNVVASPVLSLWQSGLVALRLVFTVAWTMRAPSLVQVVNGVGW